MPFKLWLGYEASTIQADLEVVSVELDFTNHIQRYPRVRRWMVSDWLASRKAGITLCTVQLQSITADGMDIAAVSTSGPNTAPGNPLDCLLPVNWSGRLTVTYKNYSGVGLPGGLLWCLSIKPAQDLACV